MADVKGGYQRPTVTTIVSCSWQCHKDRPTPSTEPGTDYAAAYGSAVYAPEDGVIAGIQTGPSGATGRYVTLKLNDGRQLRFLHLSRIMVTSGQKVKRGQEIAKSGASGFGKEWGYGAHVHVTLWDFQGPGSYLGRNTMDFATQVGGDNDGGSPAGSVAKPTQKIKDIQNSINRYRKAAGFGFAPLIVDGINGPATKAAVKAVQSFLKARNLYSGPIDGIWGTGTNTGWNAWAKKQAAAGSAPSSKYHKGTTKDAASLSATARKGLQKVGNLYVKQPIDGIWGTKSNTGLQSFLNQNYGGSLAAWLRAKWGYVGNDQWGPNMKAALERAGQANYRAL